MKDSSGAGGLSKRSRAVCTECQEAFGLRPFGKHSLTTLTDALLPQAIENDRLVYLAELVMRSCRERRFVIPSAAALERLCADLRHHARREAHRRLTNGLSAEQRKRLEVLTKKTLDTKGPIQVQAEEYDR